MISEPWSNLKLHFFGWSFTEHSCGIYQVLTIERLVCEDGQHFIESIVRIVMYLFMRDLLLLMDQKTAVGCHIMFDFIQM